MNSSEISKYLFNIFILFNYIEHTSKVVGRVVTTNVTTVCLVLSIADQILNCYIGLYLEKIVTVALAEKDSEAGDAVRSSLEGICGAVSV